MRIRALLATLCLVAAGAALPGASADAAVVTPVPGLMGAGNGIAVGADGNLWVAEEFNGTVARVSPAGVVLGRYPVGVHPTSLAAGPGGKIWVAVTGSDRLAVLDTGVATPVAVPISTPSTCGPVGIVSGGNGRMYFSMPLSDCSDVPKVGYVADTGAGPITSVISIGQAFDLEVSGGKLFVPDFTNAKVSRVNLGTLAVEATFAAPAGAQPNGIVADGSGNLWLTAFGYDGLLRMASVAGNGTPLTPVPLAGGSLAEAFGIAVSPDGHVYAAGSTSATVVRVNPDGGGASVFPTPAGSKPWQLISAPDGSLVATDLNAARLLRITDAAPAVSATTARATGTTTATVGFTVDPRGNATQVVVDQGLTTAYDASTPATSIPAAAGPTAGTVTLTGLRPGTTYHVRVRATNALGTTTSADTTLTTAAAAPAVRALAKLGSASLKNGDTRIKTLKVVDVRAGDKIRLTCRGGGCQPRATTKPAKAKKAGTLTLTKAVRGLVLKPKARLTVKVVRADGTRASAVFTMVKGKKPKVTQR